MDPTVLTVYKSPFPKLRLGKPNDGGYVIADISDVKYSILLAGGISNDISFEEDFIAKYNTPCIAFDGTINALPKNHPGIKFIQKNIGGLMNSRSKFIKKPSTAVTNLHNLIAVHNDIFIKMDIEGGEIPWIKSLSDDQMNKLAQIVMEFHRPFTHNEVDVFNKINRNHVLIHFHGNNCSRVRLYKGLVIPTVFECTYIHKKFFTATPELNTEPIPTPLDMQNTVKKNDIYISYPPFVN